MPKEINEGSAKNTRVPIWERMERPARGPKPALTHDQIAEAAVAIADADGLEAVAMRRLAERLGVATMALYRYIEGKEDLYDLMINAINGEITLPDGTWREVARSLAEQTRAMAFRHPWIVEVMSRSPVTLTPNVMIIVEAALGSLEGSGIDVDSMMAVFGTVNAFVMGAVAGAVAQQEMARRLGWTSEDDFRLAFLPYVQWVMKTGRYPRLIRYVIEGSNEDDADWHFRFGLDCVLDGIAARLGI